MATNSALTAVENKISDVSNLVKKTDYDAKILDIESNYITTANYNKFTKEIVDNSMKNKNLVDRSAFARFINNTDLYKKLATLIATLATKAELEPKQYKITKLQTFD